MGEKTLNRSENICKDCLFRFRRIFIPRNPDHFLDEEEGIQIIEGEDNIVIMNLCVISDMDLELDVTVDCTHYKCKDDVDIDTQVSIFKHLKHD